MKRELSIDVRTPGSAGSPREVAVVIDDGAVEALGRIRVTIDGVAREVDAVQVRPGTWSVLIEGRSVLVDLESRDRTAGAVAVTAAQIEVTAVVEDARHKRLRTAAQRTGPAVRGERITAPIAGKVVKVLVGVGDTVVAGQAVVVVEAMKMENELVAVRGGVVTVLGKGAGAAVDTGELLIELA